MISQLEGMSIWTILFWLSFIVAIPWFGLRLYGWWRYRKAIKRRLAEIAGPPTLDNPDIQRRLTMFLAKHGISGDADIRDGKVYGNVPPARLQPLAVLLQNAFSMIVQTPNAVNGDLYYAVKNPGEGTGWSYRCAGGVGVSDLGDAARVMQRVAEDHKKSRSLYKGMTDDEITSLVRAGMSFYYKDDGSFPESNAAAQGQLDGTPEFLIAAEVLKLAFQIKRLEA